MKLKVISQSTINRTAQVAIVIAGKSHTRHLQYKHGAWFGYPAPYPRQRASMDIVEYLLPQWLENGRTYEAHIAL